MAQNTSHAVMTQRTNPFDDFDDFPTPHWATRALLKYVLPHRRFSKRNKVLEPACGRGHMAEALREHFNHVTSFDIANYGYKRAAASRDFTTCHLKTFNWMITNPPFNQAEAFINHGLRITNKGVAIFIRSTFTESIGRHNRLFKFNPPAIIAQFSERVVLHKGKLSQHGSTATAYCWLVWLHAGLLDNPPGNTRYMWIPPCRAELERDEDYQ